MTIFGWLIAPADGKLSPHEGLPIYTSLTEILGVTIWLAIKGGIIAAILPALLTGFYLVRPVLSRRQRRMAALVIPAILLSFLTGAAFAYFVMLPVGVSFLLHFGDGIAVPAIRISEYLSIAASMIFWLGVIFEIPLLMFLLAKLRLVSYSGFKKVRKYVPPSAGILGAILTPGFDIVNALMVMVPIIVLYEVGLLLAWLAQPGKGTLMLHRMKAFVLGLLRRLVVAVIVLVHMPLVWMVYATALAFVSVLDGHFTPSPRKERVERAYAWWLRAVERVAWLRRT